MTGVSWKVSNVWNTEPIVPSTLENKVLIDTRKAQLETVQNSMSETIELELIMISEDDLPESITAQQITGILKIIK